LIYHHLYAKSPKSHATVALVGSGHFGTAVLMQLMLHSQIRISIIVDKNIESARKAYQLAGIPNEQIVYCADASSAKMALDTGKFLLMEDAMILVDLPVDVIVEATGNAEAGARHALAAIKAGKHVVMVNKETDSCVGPILFKLAAEKGVVYTPVDGDQHGALIQMLEWAKDTGLEVISAGKARDAEFIYDRKASTVTCYADEVTVPRTCVAELAAEDIEYIENLPQDKMAAYLKRRKEILKELDPARGFDLCEMVIVANSTGLIPDVTSLYDHVVRTSEIPKVLCEKKDGGLISRPGIVDVVTCLREPHESGMGGGVFMVVHCRSEYSQHILATKGCLSNERGSVSLIYRPYHLCGVEAPTTLLCAGLLGIATGPRNYRPLYDIVQTAAVDLKAGETMGNDHDIRLRTTMIPMSPIEKRGPIPAHMLSGKKLNRDVAAGTTITYDMIDVPSGSALWALRAMQDNTAF
jgi:predicted homoserine dehydrogenase-like protein